MQFLYQDPNSAADKNHPTITVDWFANARESSIAIVCTKTTLFEKKKNLLRVIGK